LAKKWNIDFAQHFEAELLRLRDMEEDGLVELKDDEIVIGETGRLLVRNVCMIFDSYQHKPHAAGSFSGTV
jgi:oxygen-independent coproporphyrinogen-3 oxidase